MKKIINIFLVLTLVIQSMSLPVWANSDNKARILGNFKSSSESFIGEAEYSYSDADFEGNAYEYNHQLAKMSLRLAMSAFLDKSSGYGTQYKNANALLSELNFDRISWNEDYTKKPTTDSIGVIAGSKKVGDSTLIAVAIRGGGYEAEWGGNFEVGDNDLHEGFRKARDKSIAFLKQYISDNNIGGDVKFWVTGYSRGAAAANLIGAYLDSAPDTFESNITVKPENIYTYCFATPAAVKNPPDAELYENIFNVVSRNDFVPLVAMEKWGYGRFGKTYYLPSFATNPEYEELEKNMQEAYNSYVKDEYKFTSASKQFSEYSYAITIPFFNIVLKETEGQYYSDTESFLNRIADELALSFKNTSYYVDNGQDALVIFGEKIIGEGRMTEFIETFKNEVVANVTPQKIINMTGNSSVEDIIKEIAKTAVKSAFEKMGATAADSVYDTVSNVFIGLLKENQLTTLIGNSDLIGQGHYPEQYMAWLDVTDKTNLTNKNGTFVVSRGIEVLLNDKAIKFDQPPIIRDDRTLVPLRAIFEALGATVSWDGETQTVTSIKGDKTVVLTIGSNILYVNGNAVELDVPAQLINDRTLVPVRAVAESFDCVVDWNGETQTVIIYERYRYAIGA